MTSKGSTNQVGFLLRYALQAFGSVLLVGILLRIFLFSTYTMMGMGMLPAIWPGDFLLGTRWNIDRIERGQIVALRCPKAREKYCLKRIVGLAGDRIEFKNGKLILNGEVADHEAIGDFANESVAGEKWLIWPDESTDLNSEPVVVPPSKLFLLNDKRGDYDDSRSWGSVDQNLLHAQVPVVWLSLDWSDGENIRSWPKVRWSRLFHRIH